MKIPKVSEILIFAVGQPSTRCAHTARVHIAAALAQWYVQLNPYLPDLQFNVETDTDWHGQLWSR